MRWVSLLLIAALVGSVQCLSACTLAACAQVTESSQLPPCHQQQPHHQPPGPDRLMTCDHRQAVDTQSANRLPAPTAFVVVELPIPRLTSEASICPFARTGMASPPGVLFSFIILRI